MNRKLLLDCTLRDGGYLNDWKFGHDTILQIFERLVNTNVDVIEIGFLDDRRVFDIDRTIMPDTSCVEKIFRSVNKKNAIVVGMIDYGTCSIDNIQECKDSYLDGIRVIFKKHIMHEAIAFCKEIKAKGYKVFAQAVSITSYNNDELLELIGLVNDLEPFAASMVDTYGLLYSDSLLKISKVFDDNLKPGIKLGYHAHNNFQLGFSNGMSFLSLPVHRDVLVDGTLYGMGKSAGNAPLELLAMHMNQQYGTNYDSEQILEAIEINILKQTASAKWGYNLLYFISASHDCHPNYVSYLINKGTLSIKSISAILNMIDDEKKLMYDSKHAESLYISYQANECNDDDDIEDLKKRLQGKTVLVFGPGKKVVDENKKIAQFLSVNRPTIMSINYIPEDYKVDYVFTTNSKRYSQMYAALCMNKGLITIATSNITRTRDRFDYELNYSRLIDSDSKVPDNSLIMLLKTFMDIGVKDVFLAGFDGYNPNHMNYFSSNLEYVDMAEKADYLNNYVKAFLDKNCDKLNVKFVTSSVYE